MGRAIVISVDWSTFHTYSANFTGPDAVAEAYAHQHRLEALDRTREHFALANRAGHTDYQLAAAAVIAKIAAPPK